MTSEDQANNHVNRRTVLKLTGAGFVLVTAGSTTALAREDDLRKAAKKYVAAKTGTGVADLAVVNESMASWSTLGEEYYNAKVRDTADNSLHQVLLDANGEPVDRNRLNERERVAYREHYGKFDKGLHAKVQDMADDEDLEVVVWLESIDHETAKQAVDIENRPNTAETKEALSAEYRRRIDAQTEAFVEQVEGQPDVEVLSTGYGSTTVDLRVTVGALEQIQQMGLVERVFDRDYDRELPLDSATKTHDTANYFGPIYDLSGYKAGHGEFDHPESGVAINYGGKRWSGTAGAHPAHTVECMASNDGSLPGTAYQADVYSADKIFDKLDDRFQWFDQQNVCAVNTSVGAGDDREIGSIDYRYGQQVYHNYTNIFVSAGNHDPVTEAGYVNSPGVAFNPNSVGAIADKNSGGHSDDVIADYSCYEDPRTKNADPNNDFWPHEKPEFSAVGTSVTTPNYSGSGTSLSSPVMTGLAVVMCKLADKYNTIDFRLYPEVVKPILTAAGAHDSTNREHWGYGVPYMNAVEEIINKGWFVSDTYNKSNATQNYSFSVDGGQNVRVALFWLSNVTASDFPDLKDAQSDIDLDLSVDAPGAYASSYSYDTGLEFAEFSPDSSGTANVTVDKFRWDAEETSRFMGLAWYRS